MGESINRVAALLRHASLDTTARYTRLSMGDCGKSGKESRVEVCVLIGVRTQKLIAL